MIFFFFALRSILWLILFYAKNFRLWWHFSKDDKVTDVLQSRSRSLKWDHSHRPDLLNSAKDLSSDQFFKLELKRLFEQVLENKKNVWLRSELLTRFSRFWSWKSVRFKHSTRIILSNRRDLTQILQTFYANFVRSSTTTDWISCYL